LHRHLQQTDAGSEQFAARAKVLRELARSLSKSGAMHQLSHREPADSPARLG